MNSNGADDRYFRTLKRFGFRPIEEMGFEPFPSKINDEGADFDITFRRQSQEDLSRPNRAVWTAENDAERQRAQLELISACLGVGVPRRAKVIDIRSRKILPDMKL